jgi:hypothetical protein
VLELEYLKFHASVPAATMLGVWLASYRAASAGSSMWWSVRIKRGSLAKVRSAERTVGKTIGRLVTGGVI